MSGDIGANYTINPNGTLNIFVKGKHTLFIPTDGLTGYNRNNNTAYGNFALLVDPTQCNLTTCDLTLATFDYIPSLAGNALYCAIFGVYLLLNLYLGFKHKTWGYMMAMFWGLVGEIIGYIARILLHNNPFDPTGNNFLIYIVCLTISPAFLSAAIYLTLGRIVVAYGESISRFKPRTYTLIFCGCDLFSLVLQAAGGGMASSSHTASGTQTGINLMLAGLSFQVVSIFIFAAMSLEYAWRLYKNPMAWETTHASLYNSKIFQAFLCGLVLATLAIFTRSIFRVAELSGGFRGSLANNQISFMILEGAMIVIATTCLTLLHPGVAFQGAWADANFTFRKRKDIDLETIQSEGESGGNTPARGENTPARGENVEVRDVNMSQIK